MKSNSDTTVKLYIGFDVHKEQTSVAIAEAGSKGEVRSHGSVATSQSALERLIRRIAKTVSLCGGAVATCAGGCGSLRISFRHPVSC